jgi:hypothetical protein
MSVKVGRNKNLESFDGGFEVREAQIAIENFRGFGMLA